MKYSWKSYWDPTPKTIRKAADAVIAGTTLAGSATILNNYPKVGTLIFIIGVIAKILSNFFTDDNEKLPA